MAAGGASETRVPLWLLIHLISIFPAHRSAAATLPGYEALPRSLTEETRAENLDGTWRRLSRAAVVELAAGAQERHSSARCNFDGRVGAHDASLLFVSCITTP